MISYKYNIVWYHFGIHRKQNDLTYNMFEHSSIFSPMEIIQDGGIDPFTHYLNNDPLLFSVLVFVVIDVKHKTCKQLSLNLLKFYEIAPFQFEAKIIPELIGL